MDVVVERVWGHRPPANAVISVRNHVARIRRTAPDLVLTVGNGYALDPGATVRFDRRRGTEVFPDLADVPEVDSRRQAIGDRIAAEVDDGLVLAIGATDTPGPQLLEQLRLAVDDEPYRETRWAVLSLAQALAGQRRESLLTLQAARTQLGEVGLDPGARLVRVEAAIVSGEHLDARRVLDPSAPLAATPPAPVSVHPHHDEPFAGRADELVALADVWVDTVRSRQPRLVVVEGPAGSGKTRLADRFIAATLAADPATRVVWGRHRVTAGRAHGAVAEGLARVFADEPDLADEAATRQLRRLVALDSGGDTTAEDAVGAPDADVAFARTRLGRELARLVNAMGRRPTIWLLDDIQWAEADTLALVEEAFDGAAAAVLLVVTARQGSRVVADVVATSGRVMPTSVITLSPLAADDLGHLVRAATDRPVSDDVLDALHRRTGGLALYVSEILRMARRTGAVDIATVPAAIRDWIQHRLRQLEPGVAHTLQLAALLDDIDLDLLVLASEADRQVVTRHCDELHAAGMLALDRHGSLTFSHEMTREAVGDALGPVQRLDLERRVAEALLETAPDDHDRLAIHFDRARDRRAFVHAMRAADRALALGAWDHARAMAAIATAHADGAAQRADSLVAAGRSLLASGGQAAARPVLEEAIQLAFAADAPATHARAALALVGRAGRGAINDDELLQSSVLRGVLQHLAGHDDADGELGALRCDLERELAIALLLSDAAEERAALLRGAHERAQHLDPPQPRALAAATLGMRYALLGPHDLSERLGHTAAVMAMPADALDPETRIAALVYRHEDLRRAGRHDEADDTLRAADRLLAAFPHPYWTWAVRTWEALGHVVRGDLDRAEAVAGAAVLLRPGVTEAAACLGVTLVDIRLYQQRAGEVVDMLRGAVAASPHIPTYRAVLALCAAEAGDHATAGDAIRWFTRTGCSNLPEDTNRFLGLAVLAHAASETRDVEAASVLLPLLEPYADQWVVLSAYGGGGASWGPAAHGLARVAGLVGDPRAAAWYDTASGMSQGAPLVLARIAGDRKSDTAGA